MGKHRTGVIQSSAAVIAVFARVGNRVVWQQRSLSLEPAVYQRSLADISGVQAIHREQLPHILQAEKTEPSPLNPLDHEAPHGFLMSS